MVNYYDSSDSDSSHNQMVFNRIYLIFASRNRLAALKVKNFTFKQFFGDCILSLTFDQYFEYNTRKLFKKWSKLY